MNGDKHSTLFTINVIVILSLIVSAVLFVGLGSVGEVVTKEIRFSGAAAGFFVLLVYLIRWHNRIETMHADQRVNNVDLEQIVTPIVDLTAKYLVQEVEESDKYLLNNAYTDKLRFLRYTFKKLDLEFIQNMEKDFLQKSIYYGSKKFPELRWQPIELESGDVVEVE